jgi:serine phosphatase RsbU (regulator of sigma subunit)
MQNAASPVRTETASRRYSLRWLLSLVPRELSVGSYLAVATTLVLLAVSTLLVINLAANGRHTALVAKRASAETVTSLFADSVWAALVFNDIDAVEKELDNLKRAGVVESAVVFAGESVDPVAAMYRVTDSSDVVRREPGVVMNDDQIHVTEVVRAPDGASVGLVVVTFSLANENREQAATKRSLAARGAILVAVTAGLLMVIARRKVIRPLMSLVAVANRIERGDLHVVSADHGGNAEIRVLGHAFDRMSVAIADREKRLLDELEVAAGLQMSILPNDPQVPGLEIAAHMEPATQVGGDYYDVIPTEDGCWMAIGDVSGHGLGAGVIMLMLQSSIAALVRSDPDASPSRIECLVNDVLFENVRMRMKRRDHATLSILRYTRDGVVRIAGAHEDIIVWRAGTRTIELIETPGTWVGAVRSIAQATVETSFVLGPDDVMVLYTDGVTEARRDGKQLGLDGLQDVVRANVDGSPMDLKNAIVSAVHSWATSLQDDISVVVLRQLPGRDT